MKRENLCVGMFGISAEDIKQQASIRKKVLTLFDSES